VHFEGAAGRRLAAGPATALAPVAPILRRADLAMVNLETAVTERGTPAAKDFTFRAPATAFSALAAAGVDVATMANNHGMDYGLVGLRDSLAAARAARFPVVGIGADAAEAFAPLRLEVGGWRVAVLGATQVLDANLAAAWSAGDGKPGLASAQGAAERLLAAVASARRSADTVVVFLHWGQELAHCPLARQRELAQALVEAGADVIVGSHAHVLLGGGRLGAAYVAYGLGNFVFSAASAATTASGVLELTVRGRQVERAAWRPARISGGVARPLDGPAAARALDEWAALRGCTGLGPD
jgi:poly-gamma-glutamate synthesis protein (capsule biosynthesis protein)